MSRPQCTQHITVKEKVNKIFKRMTTSIHNWFTAYETIKLNDKPIWIDQNPIMYLWLILAFLYMFQLCDFEWVSNFFANTCDVSLINEVLSSLQSQCYQCYRWRGFWVPAWPIWYPLSKSESIRRLRSKSPLSSPHRTSLSLSNPNYPKPK